MAEAILYGLAQRNFLGKSAIGEVTSWWRARGDLEKLGETMRMVTAGLCDAEKRTVEDDPDTIALREWLRRLKHVLYKANDLFDEVSTIDQQQSHQNMEGYNLPILEQVRLLLSRSGPICFNRKVAREIKSIREELDSIKSDMEHLKLRTDVVPMPMARFMGKRETGSFVQVEDVIGREDDKNLIVEALFLECKDAKESITVIPIMGFGGIGKTTLAQLVFNDERVKAHFDLTKWACVPEKDNSKEVIRIVLEAFTDDVWDESRDRWLDLMSLLRCGKRRSKIIVTTRSYVVAKIVGTIQEPYTLGLLSDEESWTLIKKLAFKPGQEECHPNLVPIGKEIVRRCGNVPIAIRSIASTLYTKDKETDWMQIRDVQLSKEDQTGKLDVMSVLKLSYDHLRSQELKQCFAYCALFPKDYTFKRDELVPLWMAQGFIKPKYENNSLEDTGYEYFEELLMRNFFQEAIWDDDGIKLCKMHDLVHDLALRVGGDENILVDGKGTTQQFHSELQHVRVDMEYESSGEALSSLLRVKAKQMRSILLNRLSSFDPEMVSSFTSLRSLALNTLNIKRLPNCIGKLRHLRYLDLSYCHKIKCLPSSITMLWNLQALNLRGCMNLEEWPIVGFSSLVNLKLLDVVGCKFVDMPLGFRKLKSLQKLTKFIVGKNSGVDALVDMNLKGVLVIEYCRWCDNTIAEGKRINLKGKERLTSLKFNFLDNGNPATPDNSMLLLDCLQPPPSLKVLEIRGHCRRLKSALRFSQAR